jgi:hypothetical protein
MKEEFLKHPSIFLAKYLKRMYKNMAILLKKNWLNFGY